jgi:hypothetical protein
MHLLGVSLLLPLQRAWMRTTRVPWTWADERRPRARPQHMSASVDRSYQLLLVHLQLLPTHSIHLQ